MDTESIAHAAALIQEGGVVAYATESCFGIGCHPRNHDALRRILRIKHRSYTKGLIVIADHPTRLLPYVDWSEVRYRQQILDSWPGPHTWLVPACASVSRRLRGLYPSLAVRVTAHRDAATLCRLAGVPIVSTSANRSGKRMLRSESAVRKEFGDEIDFIVPGRIGTAKTPSRIRDSVTGHVLRN